MNKLHRIMIIVTLSLIVNLALAQEDENTFESVLFEADVYVCIVDEGGTNLLKFTHKNPVGLIFSRTVDLIIYTNAATPRTVDVMHINSDTQSGTYRYINNVVNSADTTTSIPDQATCVQNHPEELSGLYRTILLPVSPDQAIIIRQPDDKIDYSQISSGSTFAGAIGIFLLNQVDTRIPHFQILRLGDRDRGSDTVNVGFPPFENEIPLYIISARNVSISTTRIDNDDNAVVSRSNLIESNEILLSDLRNNELNLLRDVLSPGRFRFAVAFGQEFIYEGNYQSLNFERAARILPQSLTIDMLVKPIDCDNRLAAFTRAEYSENGASLYYDRNFEIDIDVAGYVTCESEIIIKEILPDGRLEVAVDGERFDIAAWLVEPVR